MKAAAKVLVLFAGLAAIVVACSAGPVFDDRADREHGHDRPCYIDGRLQPGWHQCQLRDTGECCPDGYACSGDDFVKHPPPGFCRFRGSADLP